MRDVERIVDELVACEVRTGEVTPPDMEAEVNAAASSGSERATRFRVDRAIALLTQRWEARRERE